MESIATALTTLSLPPRSGTITDLAWSPDGKKLAAVTDRGVLHVWYTSTGAHLAHLRLGHRRLLTVAWARGGRALVIGSEDGTLYRVSRLTSPVLSTYSLPAPTPVPITQIVWSRSPVGRCLLVSEETLTVLDARGQPPIVVRYRQPILDVAWCADGRTLAVVCRNGLLDIWDAEVCQSRSTLGIPGAQCVSWQRDAYCLAVGTLAGHIMLRHPHPQANHQDSVLFAPFPVRSVQWGDHNLLVAGNDEGDLVLWDDQEVATASHRLTIHAPTFAFDPEGTRLAAAMRRPGHVALAEL